MIQYENIISEYLTFLPLITVMNNNKLFSLQWYLQLIHINLKKKEINCSLNQPNF